MKRICEFYASTEGNVNMVNNTGKVGAVGVIPWFAAKVYPALLLKMDPGKIKISPPGLGFHLRQPLYGCGDVGGHA